MLNTAMCAPARSVCVWCVVTGAPKRTRVAVRRGVEARVVRRRERNAGYVVSVHMVPVKYLA